MIGSFPWFERYNAGTFHRVTMPMDTPLPSTLTPRRPPNVRAVLFRLWIQLDGQLTIEFVSEAAEMMLEMTGDEIINGLQEQNLPIFGVDSAAFYQSIRDSITHHTPWNKVFGAVTPRTKTRKWIQAQDFPRFHEDGRHYFSGVLQDITPLMDAEEQSRVSYQTLKAHIDNTPLAVIEWDEHWRVKRWTGQAEAIFGWTESEVIGKHSFEWRFVHDDDAARVATIINKLIAEQSTRNVECNRNYTKDGRVRHCEWHNSVLLTDAAECRGCLSLVLDVTDRVRMSEELSRNEWRLRTALGAAGMLGWDTKISGEDYHASREYHQFFGGIGELTQESLMDVVHPDDREPLLTAIIATDAHSCELDATFRGSIPADDGGCRWYTVRGKKVETADGDSRMIGVTTDITDRKRAEEQRAAMQKGMLESQKYESLGLLAGGVAHDFNNLLTVILGNASMARMRLKPEDPAHDHLRQVESACQRATTVCRQMLAYAGKTRVAPRSLDLSALVTNSAELLRSAAGRQGRLSFQTPAGLPPIRGETQPLQQVLLNLVTNAIESYGDSGGTITITTGIENVDASASELTPAVDAGPYVFLEVRDQGQGMTDELKSRMFDPFYTTKFTGRGLGLAAVMGIVRAHRGSVRVTSKLDAGTTIRVLLPVMEKTVTSSKSPG
ncbi:hypothetical protein BH11PLA2_BH11PLA2_02230 [soil metagenome]